MPSLDWEPLLAAARRARRHAHAPHSGYRVGAAVRTADGAVFAAGNVEYDVPALSTCAERNALAAALSAGHRDLAALAVVTDSTPPARPCGLCRQSLVELTGGADLPVLCANERGERVEERLSELLPHPFRLASARPV